MYSEVLHTVRNTNLSVNFNLFNEFALYYATYTDSSATCSPSLISLWFLWTLSTMFTYLQL